ncbi:hypothetical protein RJ639_011901 [Escallonia herrerae]|uniref:Sulfotransferase n=1 Tax=Escallonia herrerae TaxID=1293975 RepID=A0AA88VKV7_9ASTE|nr:hypothetical protein RJ639_011901 [Escallonia herrerae]
MTRKGSLESKPSFQAKVSSRNGDSERAFLPLFAVIFPVIFLASTSINASASKDDLEHCKSAVNRWASSSRHKDVKEDKHIMQDLLFFLHVPRTGGRTYFHCFLKKLYFSSQERPRSYDKLRFDPSRGDSQVLVHPNLTSATRMAGRLRSKTGGVSMLDVGPRKYLVPWMRKDLFSRRDARKARSTTYSKSNYSYDMEDFVMPLHQYINDPIAQDVIRNGATFQVAGLTNNSHNSESHDVRHCVLKYQNLGGYVLEVARKRLDDMLYVGLTENHRESATMFANVVGAQVIYQSVVSSKSSLLATNIKSGLFALSMRACNKQHICLR